MQGVTVQTQRLSLDRVIRVKVKTGDAAIGSDVLVLLTDGLSQTVDLDMAGHFCQFLRVHQLALMG